MLKQTSLFLSLFFTTILGAQTQEDFDKYGKILLDQMTDYEHTQQVDFIRIREYHEIVERQDLSPNQRSAMKHQVNSTYNDLYTSFQQSMLEIAENYRLDLAEGATFEYDQTRHEPLEGSKDTYAVVTSFMYRNKKVQTMVSFIYDVAWLDAERGFVIISPVKEDF